MILTYKRNLMIFLFWFRLGNFVKISVLEAKFGSARINGAQPTRVGSDMILGMATEAQTVGQYLNTNNLDRALLVMDDLPGVSVVGSLAPGQKVGETDLILTTADEPALFGSVSLDNTGSESTGEIRANAALTLNSPARMGDDLTLMGMLTEGSQFLRLGYSMPAGNQGMRVRTWGSYMHYKVIAPEFKSLDINGSEIT